jgi:hypothetical protein
MTTANVKTYNPAKPAMAYKLSYCGNINQIDGYQDLNSFNSVELNKFNSQCVWKDLGWIISPYNKKQKLQFLGETASSTKLCETIGKLVRKPWPEGVSDIKVFDESTLEYIMIQKPHVF